MRLLSSYISEDLILLQPSFLNVSTSSDLRTELLAKMYFPKLFSLTAVIEGFEEKYEIIRPSFWKSEIAIRKYGYDLTFASLTTNFFRTKGIDRFTEWKKTES